MTHYYAYIVLTNGVLHTKYVGDYFDDAYNMYVDWMHTFTQDQLITSKCRGFGLGAELVDVICRTQTMVEQAG